MDLLESLSVCSFWSGAFNWSNMLLCSKTFSSHNNETFFALCYDIFPQHCSFIFVSSCLSYCLSIFGLAKKTWSVSSLFCYPSYCNIRFSSNLFYFFFKAQDAAAIQCWRQLVLVEHLHMEMWAVASATISLFKFITLVIWFGLQ